MDRWGCVDAPALPLQLLLRRHPDWRRHPVAVVQEDRPTAAIAWVNERALRARILPGRRYAEGLSLAADLRAGVVDAAEITAAVDEVAAALRRFSPDVEPCAGEPGVFWLDATGVKGLFPSLKAWARGIAQAVAALGLTASVVAGFDRFGTYALARSSRGVLVTTSPEDERRRADRVPLHRLGLDPSLRDALARLGVADVGAFRRLPAGGILERFGAEAHRLHRLAHGELWAPLEARTPEAPAGERVELDPGQHGLDTSALLFLCKQRLSHLAARLRAEDKVIAGLRLRLLQEKLPPRDEELRPAEPTLDEVQLVELLRLRLEALQLDAALEAFELHAEAVPARARQAELFARTTRRRDLAAGDRALARLRAEFGEAAVVHAELRDGHLPEARFVWRPLAKLVPARPGPVVAEVDDEHACALPPRLVRRVLARPRRLTRQRAEPDGWFLHGLSSGPLRDLWGPYVISGGWWHREQHREYHFAETRGGEVLWIYRDARDDGWFLQGFVE